ncbi:MAG TPA: periplasmic heavy metal sensor [Pyrinomonadaceae bacterium]|nr:periplasmic heavy metal sensor [Pyrinomonadaceae bacterium]
MRSRTFMTLLAAVLFFTVAVPVFGMQDPAPQDVPPDPIEQLRLTPEQRQRIRMIVEENKLERQRTNRRLREANVALDQALDSEPVNESVIDQRVNELAAAQAAQLRMRIQTEIKIRRELRPEQLAMLRQLRLQIRDVVGGQRPANTFQQRPGRNALRPNRKN